MKIKDLIESANRLDEFAPNDAWMDSSGKIYLLGKKEHRKWIEDNKDKWDNALKKEVKNGSKIIDTYGHAINAGWTMLGIGYRIKAKDLSVIKRNAVDIEKYFDKYGMKNWSYDPTVDVGKEPGAVTSYQFSKQDYEDYSLYKLMSFPRKFMER